jgi:hypothetical protein
MGMVTTGYIWSFVGLYASGRQFRRSKIYKLSIDDITAGDSAKLAVLLRILHCLVKVRITAVDAAFANKRRGVFPDVQVPLPAATASTPAARSDMPL